MKRTLTNLGLGTILAGAFLASGCEKKTERKQESSYIGANQTEWQPHALNQKIRYTYGKNSSEYELLTDTDSDGAWDILERKACGYNGQAEYGCQHSLFIKQGLDLSANFLKEPKEEKTQVNFVEPEFFKPYQ